MRTAPIFVLVVLLAACVGGAPDPSGNVEVGGDEWIVSIDGWALHVRSGTWVELPAPDGAPFQAAAKASDRLFVWGGMTVQGELLGAGWAWVPGAGS